MVDTEDASNPRAWFPRHGASLHDVPSAVIGLMAEYLQPPEVYHLRTVLDKDLIEGYPPFLFPSSAFSVPAFDSILATSLEDSLKCTLEKNKVGSRNTYASFARLAAELGPGQPGSPCLSRGLEWKSAAVAISGGIMVQTALGETWKGSDIDVYCTQAAAPAVRTWLIKDMKQVLVGVNSRYKDVVPWSLKDPVVDHIEYWANTPADGERFKRVRGPAWEFDYEEACIDGPVGFQGNAVFDGTESIDDDFPGFVMRTKDDIPIPFESRLLFASDINGARKTKKDIVGFDLIVVKSGHAIARAIQNFDIDICKCSWDGLGSFHVPAPRNTFRRMSELSNGQEANEMLFYAKCITVESQKPFSEMMKELRAKHRETHTMLWAKQLKHLQAMNKDLAELFVQLELVVDTFNVFSPEFDCALPVNILWLARELREMLIQNVMGRPGTNGHEKHNSIMKSLERIEKYNRRGITVKPRPHQSGALRTLPTHGNFSSTSNLTTLGTSMPSTLRTSRLDMWATSEHSVAMKVALKPVGVSSYRQRWRMYGQFVVRAQQKNALSASALAAVTPKGATAQIGPRRKKTKVVLPLLPEKETGRSARFLPRHRMPHCSKSKNEDRFSVSDH